MSRRPTMHFNLECNINLQGMQSADDATPSGSHALSRAQAVEHPPGTWGGNKSNSSSWITERLYSPHCSKASIPSQA